MSGQPKITTKETDLIIEDLLGSADTVELTGLLGAVPDELSVADPEQRRPAEEIPDDSDSTTGSD